MDKTTLKNVISGTKPSTKMLSVDKTMDKENVIENIDSQNDEMLEEEIEETQEEKTERAKSQIDRLKAEREKAKQEAEELRLKLQKYEKSTESVEKKTSNDGFDEKYASLELKIAGITDTEDRELVLSYAKMNGVSVEEALETSFVKRGLTINKQERAERNANVEPNNRVADKSGDAMFRKALNHYNKTGEVLDGLDIITTNKLLKYLKTK